MTWVVRGAELKILSQKSSREEGERTWALEFGDE